MKKMNKGNMLIGCLLSLLIIGISIMILLSLAHLEKNVDSIAEAKNMNKYWRNLERFKMFIPIEKPVDIVY